MLPGEEIARLMAEVVEVNEEPDGDTFYLCSECGFECIWDEYDDAWEMYN
jgi:hypothetical protein